MGITNTNGGLFKWEFQIGFPPGQHVHNQNDDADLLG